MLFITEDKLRDEYKKSPFDSYIVKKGQKLTPQARQFLLDFRIKILDEKEDRKKTKKKVLIKEKNNENPINNKNKLYKNIAIITKELSKDIKNIDHDFASFLDKLARNIYKNEKTNLKSIENKKDLAVEIFINMDLENPYLEAFTMINKAIEKLKLYEDFDKELFEKISSNLYSWFINIEKGGESY